MANYEIPQNPQYDEEIRKLETGDPAHADVFNSIFGRIIRNVAFLKRDSVSREDLGIPDGVTPSVESQVPVIPAPAVNRENIADGDNMGTILSKIKRWFADLKSVAFTGSYNDLSNKPSAMKNPKALKINGKTYDGSAETDAGTLGVAYGGTGAATAADARKNLGAADVNHNHSAAHITTGTLPVSRGGTGGTDAATARAGIRAADVNHNHLAAHITSGELSVARGGTGASSPADARKNLGAADVNHGHLAAHITSGELSVARGGTGASSPADARKNLGAAAANHTHPTANNLTTTAEGYILDARQGKVLKDSINQLNSDLHNLLSWKLAGTATGNVTIPLSNANEVYIEVRYSSFATTLNIPVVSLGDAAKTYAVSFNDLGTNYTKNGGFISVSKTSVSLQNYVYTGTDRTSSTTVSVYYR